MNRFYTVLITGIIFLLGFFMNFHFIKHLSPREYVEYGTLVMIISVVNSTGALGMEQLAFRQIKANTVKIIPIAVIAYSLLSSVFFSLVLIILGLTDLSGFLMIILLSLNMVLSTILRGLGFVNTSIITLNTFKLVIPIMIFLTWSLVLLKLMICIGILVSILSAIYIFIRMRIKLYFERPKVGDIVPYFLALLSMSAMSYFDKIIIFLNANSSISSEFYLYSSTVIAPFAVIQVVSSSKLTYYYSAAENAFYKNRMLLKDYSIYMILGVFASLTALYVYMDSINWPYFIVFFITGVVRFFYTNYSSYISVNLKSRNHKVINFYALILVAVITLLSLTSVSTLYLGIIFLGLWLSRLFVWRYVVQNN
jgi:hypothetical protein